ncbi:MAG: YigZ family protein [Flavobacteriales bacterium]
MSIDRYRTLSGTTEGTHRELASKFIARAFPIPDEEAFKTELARFEKEHPSARHFCYGWVLGPEGEQHRANDAGEPNGTAGRPILRRIQALDLSFAAVIVVRYFGGTLLGKPGLVHAYGQAAQLALDGAAIIERLVLERSTVYCGYDRVDQLKADVLANEGLIVESVYSASCTLTIDLPIERVDALAPKWELLGIRIERH